MIHARPSKLLVDNLSLLTQAARLGPILDLACGEGRNGLYLAAGGLPVILVDRNESSLEKARDLAREAGVPAEVRCLDLEKPGSQDLFPESSLGGVIVFRYLHRPLIPVIRNAIRDGGVLVYETFTMDQLKFGKPHNPDFLLRPGELKRWFSDWDVLYEFEGFQPERAIAQIVCVKKISA